MIINLVQEKDIMKVKDEAKFKSRTTFCQGQNIYTLIGIKREKERIK